MFQKVDVRAGFEERPAMEQSPAAPREVTVDEAMAIAIRLR